MSLFSQIEILRIIFPRRRSEPLKTLFTDQFLEFNYPILKKGQSNQEKTNNDRAKSELPKINIWVIF
jgi:hypothetical protein